MPHKTSRRMVALSASAIATIYATGFMLTRSADANLSGQASGTPASPTIGAPPLGTSSTARLPVVGASASSAAAPAASVAATSAYADGTYSGQGTSRRGGVHVSVTVQGGTVANVQIMSVSTQYPVSRIASLPSLVVKQQSANVNTISGATYSSLAFKQAVQQALTLAQASKTSATG